MHRLLLIINLRTAVVVLLAIISTWTCSHYGLMANFSVTFLLTAVIFPVVFSIHSAYERREKALKDYATLKSNGRSLFLALRDWIEQPQPGSLSQMRDKLESLFDNLVRLLTSDQSAIEDNQLQVYQAFSDLSRFIRTDMRQQKMAATEVSRVNNYLNEMILAFESIKHIYQYRTPVTLKMFGDFFVVLVPVLYGPYFAYSGQEYTSGLLYVMPVLFSIVLTALVNIRTQLENPFDQFGEDDVVFNTRRFISTLEEDPQGFGGEKIEK
ncbi:MAG: hypothetical protein R3F41_13660 [Gammaproteobacteria bacterium]|nr:hypothetical protein [Pseudomonadales bacterium]MCP5349148.1 hypothetical protein [Pseudomonadales bacterium]